MRAPLSGNTWLEYDEQGKGVCVVLLHAFPLDKQMWGPQQSGLATEARLIAPDFRGFGGSSPSDESFSLDRMADDVAGLLDVLQIREPVVLGGLSMGGYAALAFARKHAARLRGLILADTRSEADSAEARANRDKMIAFTEQHSGRDVIDQMLPKMLSPETLSRKPDVVEEVRRIASAQTPAGIIGALRVLRDRPDATASLASIRVPTLVIVGTDDALTPPAVAEKLASGIAGARQEKIPGAGHLSNLEQPERFNAALRSFLQGLAS
jgi:pimeloyl-ACP methyl ester carboxylesterase